MHRPCASPACSLLPEQLRVHLFHVDDLDRGAHLRDGVDGRGDWKHDRQATALACIAVPRTPPFASSPSPPRPRTFPPVPSRPFFTRGRPAVMVQVSPNRSWRGLSSPRARLYQMRSRRSSSRVRGMVTWYSRAVETRLHAMRVPDGSHAPLMAIASASRTHLVHIPLRVTWASGVLGEAAAPAALQSCSSGVHPRHFHPRSARMSSTSLSGSPSRGCLPPACTGRGVRSRSRLCRCRFRCSLSQAYADPWLTPCAARCQFVWSCRLATTP